MSLAMVVQEAYIYFYVSYVIIHIATLWNDVYLNRKHSVMSKLFTTCLCSIFNFNVGLFLYYHITSAFTVTQGITHFGTHVTAGCASA